MSPDQQPYRVEFTGCGAAVTVASTPDQARRIIQHALLHGDSSAIPITEACLLPVESITPINESARP